MFDIGFSELMLVGVIALIVLGPEKLPQAARTAGKWYSKIRRGISTLQAEIEAELDLAETRKQLQEELAKIKQTEAQMRKDMQRMQSDLQQLHATQSQELTGLASVATPSPLLANQPRLNTYFLISPNELARRQPQAPWQVNYTLDPLLNSAQAPVDIETSADIETPIITKTNTTEKTIAQQTDKNSRGEAQ